MMKEAMQADILASPPVVQSLNLTHTTAAADADDLRHCITLECYITAMSRHITLQSNSTLNYIDPHTRIHLHYTYIDPLIPMLL